MILNIYFTFPKNFDWLPCYRCKAYITWFQLFNTKGFELL